MTELEQGLTFFKDDAGEWRWRVVVSSDITADSAQGYKRKADAAQGAVASAKAIVDWSITFLDEVEPE